MARIHIRRLAVIRSLAVGVLAVGAVLLVFTRCDAPSRRDITVGEVPATSIAPPARIVEAASGPASDAGSTVPLPSGIEGNAAPELAANPAPPPESVPDARPLRTDWRTGNRSDYIAELDYSNVYSGMASFRMASRTEAPRSFGSVGQAISANDYRGKRVSLTGYLKTANASDWAGLWFRVDGADGRVLAFDNMQAPTRSLRGTTDWTRSSLVLNVPDNAAAMNFGVVLSGTGTVWMDAFRIEVVDAGTPVTGRPYRSMTFAPPPASTLPSNPGNMDFEP